jgi:hypothetical protein
VKSRKKEEEKKKNYWWVAVLVSVLEVVVWFCFFFHSYVSLFFFYTYKNLSIIIIIVYAVRRKKAVEDGELEDNESSESVEHRVQAYVLEYLESEDDQSSEFSNPQHVIKQPDPIITLINCPMCRFGSEMNIFILSNIHIIYIISFFIFKWW